MGESRIVSIGHSKCRQHQHQAKTPNLSAALLMLIIPSQGHPPIVPIFSGMEAEKKKKNLHKRSVHGLPVRLWQGLNWNSGQAQLFSVPLQT